MALAGIQFFSLQRGLREMLSDQDLVHRLYNHSLISGLFRGTYDSNKKRNLPTYTLMDMIQPAMATLLSGTAGTAAASPPRIRYSSSSRASQRCPEGGIAAPAPQVS